MDMEPQPEHQHQHQHQHQMEQHEEEEQHPYMSLYEPLRMFETEELPAEAVKAEADACPSSSSLSSLQQQQQQQQEHQQPEEVSSSSNAAVTDHSHPLPSRSRPRLDDTTTGIDIDRANKKRQKIEISDDNNNNNNNNNNEIADNEVNDHAHVHVQSVTVGHKENNCRVNLNEQVDHILKIFLDDDDDDDDDNGAADGAADDVDFEGSDGCINTADSFNSIDNEKNSEHIKLATKKEKQKMNSKRQSEITATTTTPTPAPIRGIDEESNENRSDSGNNNATIRRITTNKQDTRWMELYQRLVAYKKEHNDTIVPRSYNEDPQLGCWVYHQRTAYRNKQMAEERKRFLNYIGFVWDRKVPGTSTATWEKMYQQLVGYKKVHNDTDVPRRYMEDPKLGIWVHNQRVNYRTKKMTEERKRLLNYIGFVWDGNAPGTSTATWEEMYQRLVAYKQEHNDTNVPRKYNEDPKLGRWVSYQRTVYRNKQMTEERKRFLNYIGFVWDRKRKMTEERKRLLNSIGLTPY